MQAAGLDKDILSVVLRLLTPRQALRVARVSKLWSAACQQAWAPGQRRYLRLISESQSWFARRVIQMTNETCDCGIGIIAYQTATKKIIYGFRGSILCYILRERINRTCGITRYAFNRLSGSSRASETYTRDSRLRWGTYNPAEMRFEYD